jgi:hypothetical protein
VHDEHGTRRCPDDALRDAADEEPRELAAAMGAHDDHIAPGLPGKVHDGGRRVGSSDHGDFGVKRASVVFGEHVLRQLVGGVFRVGLCLGEAHRRLEHSRDGPGDVFDDMHDVKLRAKRARELTPVRERCLSSLSEVRRNEHTLESDHGPSPGHLERRIHAKQPAGKLAAGSASAMNAFC